MEYLTTEQLEAELVHVLASPRDQGKLEAIVVRPVEDGRQVCSHAYLSAEGGVKGDRWVTSSSRRLPDGRPDPQVQVSLMNARLLRMLAGSEERISLAGDNLVVDLDLSEANMPVGQRLSAGEAVLEITDVPHTGCQKFAQRFGPDAVRFVNAVDRHSLHLRERYARILKAGTLRVGDTLRKLQ